MGLRRFIPPSIRSRLGMPLNGWRKELAFSQSEEVSSRIANLYDYNGDMLQIFAENKGGEDCSQVASLYPSLRQVFFPISRHKSADA